MIYGLPEEELFASGHNLCPGCGEAIIMRLALKAAGKNTIVVGTTGCSEISTTLYPETAFKVPWIHVAFENAAAVASGIVAALKYKKENVNVIVFAGDGGTADIGLQALSGALERGHDFTYICMDNSGYMNTGNQRSGSTEKYAATTTTPAGKVIPGKLEWKKPLIQIIAAHEIPYIATATVAFPNDLFNKVKRAIAKKGPSYVQVLSPCPSLWKHDTSLTVEISRLAVQTNLWPLYEIDDGNVKLTMNIQKRLPIERYLETQTRFKHLFKGDNRKFIKEIQEHTDKEYSRLLKKE